MNHRIAKKIAKRPDRYRGLQLERARRKVSQRLRRHPDPAKRLGRGELVQFRFLKDATDAVVVDVPQAEPIDYSALTVAELKALCKEAGIKGISKMKKADLISALL